jgi:hypothetical protein
VKVTCSGTSQPGAFFASSREGISGELSLRDSSKGTDSGRPSGKMDTIRRRAAAARPPADAPAPWAAPPLPKVIAWGAAPCVAKPSASDAATVAARTVAQAARSARLVGGIA